MDTHTVHIPGRKGVRCWGVWGERGRGARVSGWGMPSVCRGEGCRGQLLGEREGGSLRLLGEIGLLRRCKVGGGGRVIQTGDRKYLV